MTTAAERLRPPQVLLIGAALAVGLAADVGTDIIGQALIGIAVWGLMLSFLARIPASERASIRSRRKEGAHCAKKPVRLIDTSPQFEQ